jgi:hypothetical protein
MTADPARNEGQLMTFYQRLWRVELIALAVLGACGVIHASWEAARAVIAGGVLGPALVAWMVFAGTVMTGALPVIFVGAPVYAGLRRGDISITILIGLGAAPGALLSLVAIHLGLIAMAMGVFTALLTHVIFEKYCR